MNEGNNSMTEEEITNMMERNDEYVLTLIQSAKNIREALDKTTAELESMRPNHQTERIDFNNGRFHELVSVLNRFLIEMRLIESHMNRLRIDPTPKYGIVHAEKDIRQLI